MSIERRFAHRHLGLGLVAAAAALTLSGCDKAATQTRAETLRPVLVEKAHFAPAIAPRSLVGVVKARTETDLGFRVGGKIAERFVDRGARVKTGQPLAVLDRTDWTLQLQQAQAALAAARSTRDQAVAERDRISELRQKGWSTSSDRDKANATADQAIGAFLQAERAVTLQQNALSYATLVADADGIITATPAEPGQVVAQGQAVVTLAHKGAREADVAVPETMLDRVRDGKASVVLWSRPDKVYRAKLRELTPTADAATRTYPARFTIEDAGDEVELGMTATVTITDASSLLAKLPIGSILDEGKGPSVFVVDPQTKALTRHQVTVDRYDSQSAFVSTGISEGDEVVSLGVQKLHAGDVVRLSSQAAL